MFHTALSTLCFGAIAASQFVPFPTDLKTAKGYAGYNVRYKEVPTGICELDPKVKSYAGYVDVAKDKVPRLKSRKSTSSTNAASPSTSGSLKLVTKTQETLH